MLRRGVSLIYLLLAAAIGTASPAGVRPSSRAKIAHVAEDGYIAQLRKLVDRFGLDVLKAVSESELDRIVSRVVDDHEFLQGLLDLMSKPPPAAMPREGRDLNDAIGMFVRDASSRFGSEFAELFRQGLEISIEFLHRMPHVDMSELARADLDAERTEQDRDMIAVSLYAFAIMAALFHADEQVEPKVGALLAHRWFDGSRQMMRLVDPLQDALDIALLSFPEPVRSDTMRLAYREGEGTSGDPTITVWIVLHDATPKARRSVGGDLQIAMALARTVRPLEREEPIFVRVRLGSDPDPSGWDLRG
jgi:hypothetical protein